MGVTASAATTRVNRVAVIGDDVWATTVNGVVRYTPSTGESKWFFQGSQSNSDYCWDIVPDGQGGVVIGSSSRGVVTIVGDEVGYLDFGDFQSSVSGTAPTACHALTFDDAGRLWIGAKYDGLLRRADGRWTAIAPGMSQLSSMFRHTAVKCDAQGAVWLASNAGYEHALGRYTDDGGYEALGTVVSAMISDWSGNFNSMAIEADGRVLLCDSYSGIYRYDRVAATMEHIALPDGIGQDGSALAFDVHVAADGAILVACRDMLLTYDGERWTTVRLPISYPDEYATCLAIDGHRRWVGTNTARLVKVDAGGSVDAVDLSVAGLDIVAADEAMTAAPVYDVMGRRVSVTVPGQLYIKAGHKFVAR